MGDGPSQRTGVGAEGERAAGSLLDDLGAGAVVVPRASVAARVGIGEVLGRARRSRWVWAGVGAAVVAAGGWGLWANWRAIFPRATPNVAEGDIEEALDFTLVSAEFNKLSVAERLRIVRELMGRLRSGSAEDSALIAAFAAGITGAAREQLRENAERLFIDVWSDAASRYAAVAPEDREKFLEEAFLEFGKLAEDLGAEPTQEKDADRLKKGREDAKQELARAQQGEQRLTQERAQRFFGFMTERGLGKTSPVQRQAMQTMQRDMVRMLRNQDLNTGDPRDGG
jgi:hypothetical protein